jgi:hypothetical protein
MEFNLGLGGYYLSVFIKKIYKMGEKIIENPILYAIINLAAVVIIMLFFCKIYIDVAIKIEMSNRQDPIVEKLDTLINIYKNERRNEIGDTTALH